MDELKLPAHFSLLRSYLQSCFAILLSSLFVGLLQLCYSLQQTFLLLPLHHLPALSQVLHLLVSALIQPDLPAMTHRGSSADGFPSDAGPTTNACLLYTW